MFLALIDSQNQIGKNESEKSNGDILKGEPFPKTPTIKTKILFVENSGFIDNIIGVLELGIVSLEAFILNLFNFGINFGGIDIGEIINENIGNLDDKYLKIQEKDD